MEYYLILPGEDIDKIDFHTHLLGEKSFNVFWAADAFRALMNISKEFPDKLDELRIIDSKRNELNVEEFMNKLERLEIRL